jgi:hypothetical protein
VVTSIVEGTLREARERFFIANGFGAGGNYDDAWVKLMLGPITVAFPNSSARVRAVRYHDLHHLMTGYSTHIIGEFEISAWELAGGCGRLWFAWMINMTGLFAGLLVAPRAVYRAFVRGRHTRNLYDRPFNDALLELRLDELRAELGFDAHVEPRAIDRVMFVIWVALASIASAALLVALLAPVAGLVWLLLRFVVG